MSRRESFNDGTIEDAFELAYWKYDARRRARGQSESDRDSFKWILRELWAARGPDDDQSTFG